MGCGGRDEALQGRDDQARVAVDVAADGEEGDASVGDAEGGEEGAGEVGGLQLGKLGREGRGRGGVAHALLVGDVADGEVPGYAAGVGGEGVVEEDDVVGG